MVSINMKCGIMNVVFFLQFPFKFVNIIKFVILEIEV